MIEAHHFNPKVDPKFNHYAGGVEQLVPASLGDKLPENGLAGEQLA